MTSPAWRISTSSSCRYRFANKGLTTAPCGLPEVGVQRVMSSMMIWSPKSGRHEVDNQPCGGSDEIRTESEVHGGVSRGGGRAGDSGPAWIARGCAESGDVGQDAGELGGQCA